MLKLVGYVLVWHCVISYSSGASLVSEGSCRKTEHRCEDGSCIPGMWRCDGDADCPRGSDEVGCLPTTTRAALSPQDVRDQCRPGYIPCPGGPRSCIPQGWRCDGMKDCADGSDETGCPTTHSSTTVTMTTTTMAATTTSVPPPAACGAAKFACSPMGPCVPKDWRCDGDKDCDNGRDEKRCPPVTAYVNPADAPLPRDCFVCTSGVQCISRWWVCDGEPDCDDGSDEVGCGPGGEVSPTPVSGCPAEEFRCASGDTHCIPVHWSCDSEADCDDGSDELNCPECTTEEFRCESGQCLPLAWRCDDAADCLDGTDEVACDGGGPPTSPTPPPTTPPPTCPPTEMRCGTGELVCVPEASRCDGRTDCPDGSDERGCYNGPGPFPWCAFLCHGGAVECVPEEWRCDGSEDCENARDEQDCPT